MQVLRVGGSGGKNAGRLKRVFLFEKKGLKPLTDTEKKKVTAARIKKTGAPGSLKKKAG